MPAAQAIAGIAAVAAGASAREQVIAAAAIDDICTTATASQPIVPAVPKQTV